MNTKIQLIIDRSFPKALFQLTWPIVLAAVLCIPATTAKADLPMTGYPVSELTVFDTMMQAYMADHGLQAGILAISKDGRVVYQRGFGYAYNGTDPLPENTPMRLASVEKPHTAAVIRHLIADGDFNLDDFVFSVPGQTLDPGQQALLDASTPSSQYYPYDNNFEDLAYLQVITVNHLLNHRGGWDRGWTYDPFGILLDIGNATNTYPSSPPARQDIVQFMMSEPMQFDPSNPVECNRDPNDDCMDDLAPCYCDPYSNYGYMLLSLIIEQETGEQHTEAIRQRVLTPEIWVPETEVFMGRDFRVDQNPREPKYVKSNNCYDLTDPYQIYPGVFNPVVPCPYGGLLMEVKTGEGNLVEHAAPLMMFMNHYDSWFGTPISGPVDHYKNGGLDGTSTRIEQRSTGFNVAVLFAQGGGHADEVMPQVYTYLGLLVGVDWESLKAIDGFWVDFNASSSGYGGHDDPFHTMNSALAATTDGTKLRFKSGTSSWTGIISERMMLNSPLGTAIIGQ